MELDITQIAQWLADNSLKSLAEALSTTDPVKKEYLLLESLRYSVTGWALTEAPGDILRQWWEQYRTMRRG